MKRFILLTVTLIAAFSLSGCSYNDLTAKQQNVKGKWANVESSLQRRADLIPNLVNVAQQSAIQEQEVFGQIADSRSRLLNATQAPPQGENGDKSPVFVRAICRRFLPAAVLVSRSKDENANRRFDRRLLVPESPTVARR